MMTTNWIENERTAKAMKMTEKAWIRIKREAYQLGRDAGHAAATWCYNGNTPEDWYGKTLDGIRDGDPAILDAFHLPNLSGEYAGDPTPATLMEDLGLQPSWDEDEGTCPLGITPEDESELCSMWEEGVSDGFWHHLEQVCEKTVTGKD